MLGIDFLMEIKETVQNHRFELPNVPAFILENVADGTRTKVDANRKVMK